MKSEVCPHCRGSFLSWDREGDEPYCFCCGWRRAVKLTPEQAKYRGKNKSLWLSILAQGEKIPDLNTFI
jgi:hypothetical protein